MTTHGCTPVRLAALGLMLLSLVLSGCASRPAPPVVSVTPEPMGPPAPAIRPVVYDDIWARIREGMSLGGYEQRPEVRAWTQFYAARTRHIEEAAQRATPFIWHIAEAVERHDMPLEIALLPIVESGFDPRANSYSSAAGLWQFMPLTASRFGLERNWWYDGRRDVLSATSAALDYLGFLHRRFDDWLLALAAYNAGEGRVGRAVARAEAAGQPGDFWHLELPAETDDYVPKLLALRRLLQTPGAFDLALPAIPDRPLTEAVQLDAQIDFSVAAEMIDIPTQTLADINPGFRRWATHPEGPHRLLVPSERSWQFRTALARTDPAQLVTWHRHQVQAGEVLGGIAARYGTTVAMIREANNMRDSVIRPGEDLRVPAKPAQRLQTATESGGYQVSGGDSLWRIARDRGMSVDHLRHLNGLSAKAVLQPGQTLRLHDPNVTPRPDWSLVGAHEVAASTPPTEQAGGAGETPTTRSNAAMIYYDVQQGDSLWSIARSFEVTIAALRRWNRLEDNRLQPGQRLRIRLASTI
ncbi:LysM peptidoglycan-binding domain-containing protein [Spectribacter hydrogenooxidans]|uniref:LysM peptidoglycan-binding domain-containing protein n=1 Tax=Spectribacter hydrogenoxidans TaxID=3075608 RepID=A0ABU3C0Q9_9GAMM|nr:LysM peptidoglycan-binding domain-containing protein [Salinisphaera sp. W335]MDT0635140.1 LysM peptidoglycan-binding domain-containing protein [Salinisphaera sp. W335]